MVGDSMTDIATAKAARIPVVAVDFGYTDIPPAQLGADRLIGHFDALKAAVQGLLTAR
jgi:phosphoglycolate phosphatase